MFASWSTEGLTWHRYPLSPAPLPVRTRRDGDRRRRDRAEPPRHRHRAATPHDETGEVLGPHRLRHLGLSDLYLVEVGHRALLHSRAEWPGAATDGDEGVDHHLPGAAMDGIRVAGDPMGNQTVAAGPPHRLRRFAVHRVGRLFLVLGPHGQHERDHLHVQRVDPQHGVVGQRHSGVVDAGKRRARRPPNRGCSPRAPIPCSSSGCPSSAAS